MRVGVLLAGGASRRMGARKALRRLADQSFMVHAVRRLWRVCDSVVVVLGSGARELRRATEEEFQRLVKHGGLHADLRSAHRHGAAGLEARFVVNPRWRSGMLSSARAGLREALRARPEAILVLPVDHPHVREATVERLAGLMSYALAAYGKEDRASRFAYAVIPRHKLRRGHPVILSPALAKAIASDRGARDLSDAVRRHARMIGYLDCPDPGVVRNRNTPRD